VLLGVVAYSRCKEFPGEVRPARIFIVLSPLPPAGSLWFPKYGLSRLRLPPRPVQPGPLTFPPPGAHFPATITMGVQFVIALRLCHFSDATLSNSLAVTILKCYSLDPPDSPPPFLRPYYPNIRFNGDLLHIFFYLCGRSYYTAVEIRSIFF